SPGDFMILSRTTGALFTYARALEARGLPYDISGGGSPRQAPELRALVDVLEAVQRPDDPVPLLAYLRGPLVGLADDELAAFRRADGQFAAPPWPPSLPAGPAVPAGLADDLRSRLDEAFQRLGCLRQWLERLTPAAALERLVDQAGLLAFAAAGEAGSSRAGSLVRVLSLVRHWQAGGRLPHWGAALAELRALLEDGAHRIEEMTLEIGQPGVVRLMNLHQAKGLEAAVVFLADPCDTSHARHAPDVHVSRLEGRPYLSMVASRPCGPWSRQVIAEPAGWPEDAEREAAFVKAEELRVVYVAATRARDALVISTYEGDAGAGSWSCLYPILESAPDLPVPAPVDEAPPRLSAIDREKRTATLPARRQRVLAPTQVVRAVTDAEGQAEVGLASEGGRGRTFGTFVHRLLEAVVAGRLPAGPAAGVEAWALHLASELGVGAEQVAEAVAVLETFRGSPLWAEVSGASPVYAEVPFGLVETAALASAEGEPPAAPPPVVRGVIDLVYRTPEGWKIVDYKTDRPGVDDPAAALRARCGGQVAAYAQYWQELTGEPVVAAGLWTAELGYLAV
ncbi:MAG: 3'-5' exonuclease, partial [Gemmatimonadota bacterium]